MSALGRGVDALGLYLTGGASNTNPDLSLGGAISSRRVRGWGAIVDSPVPSLRIDQVYPASALGVGSITVNTDGTFSYTPPRGATGAPVSIPAGTGAVLQGVDLNQAVTVFNEAGLPAPAQTTEQLELVEVFNGAISQGNVLDAQRVAGRTTYRAVALAGNPGSLGVLAIRLWLPPVSGAQATWSLGVEYPVGGVLQSVPDEATAPSGVAWTSPTTEGAALVVPAVSRTAPVGLWIRRAFPAVGHVDVHEDVQLSIKYRAA